MKPLTKQSFIKKTIFVSITRAMSGQVNDVVIGKTSIEDMARGYWYLDLRKASQCEWLVAVSKDVIVGMWEIASAWKSAFTGATPSRLNMPVDHRRYFCDVRKIPIVVLANYINQRMSSIQGLGSMRGPVRYSF